MIKPGIWRADQLQPPVLSGPVAAESPVAITLNPEIAATSDADRDRMLDAILLSFSTAKGTYKRTYAARFLAFDGAVVEFLLGWFEDRDALHVHDLATSDGRTAVEFCNPRRDAGFAIAFLATDATPRWTPSSMRRSRSSR